MPGHEAASALISAANLLGAAGFAYIALRLYRASRLLAGGLDASTGFALLAAAQLLGAAAPIAEGRAAFALYSSTSAFSAAGLLVLVLASRGHQNDDSSTIPALAALLSSPLLIPMTLDASALLASLAALLSFRGPARLMAAGLVTSFTLRLAGLVLAPSPESVIILASGEVLRGVTAAAAAALYAYISR